MTRYLTQSAVVMILVAAAPASAAPTASFSINPSPAVRQTPTTFTSTGRCDKSPCTYRWFHGPASSTEEIATNLPQPRTTASFTYVGAPGPRTITLKVRNRRDQQTSVTRTFSLVNPSTSPPSPPAKCANGLDDDGDGLVDLNDPGCTSSTDDDESNAAPPPPSTGDQFPNRRTTGVPDGWVPAQTRSTDLVVNTPRTVVQDVLLTSGANILVNAPDVTIRRVKLQGGDIDNWSSGTCYTGMLIEDTTLEPVPGQLDRNDLPSIRWGGYTARRVEIVNRGEGYRSGGCGPIRVEDSFTYIKGDEWGTPWCLNDSHSDGYQSYHARGATFVNNTIVFANPCGTSPFYAGYSKPESSCAGRPNSSCPPSSNINTGTYNVDRMLISGGGAVYRHQTPGSVTGLRIVNNSWVHFAIDNRCSVLSPWEAKIVDIDTPVSPYRGPSPDADYRVTRIVRDQPCNTEVVE
jgi:hypothetical protein